MNRKNIELTKDDIEAIAYDRAANRHKKLYWSGKIIGRASYYVAIFFGVMFFARFCEPFNEYFSWSLKEGEAIIILAIMVLGSAFALWTSHRINKVAKAMIEEK